MSRQLTLGLLVPTILVLSACQTVPKPDRIAELHQLMGPDDVYRELPDPRRLNVDESTQVGYFLFDPKTKEVLEKQNADQFFIPASTSKVPTTVAALRILGGDYRFKTYLAYRGKIKNGILYGDLYLKGTGDPALKIPHWIDFSKVLAKQGVKRVEGHFYYDESFFKSAEVIEEGREPWAPYNGGVSALSLDFNQFNAKWYRAKDGLSYVIYSVPELPFVQFKLLAAKLTHETRFLYDRTQESDRWLISETEVQGGKQSLPIHRPALAAASLFASICQMDGIFLPAPESGVLPLGTKTLAVHVSPPLVDLVNDVLEYSNNLMAELIQLATARHLVKRPVDVGEATEIVTRWVIREAITLPSFPGGLQNAYHFVNGSGLTTQNRITPAQLATVVALGDHFSFQSRSYETLLPISGYKGSLTGRLAWPGYAFHVRAKTGSMNYTNALAGYIYTHSGRRLIFAVMNSHLKERARLDHDDLGDPMDLPLVSPPSPHPIPNGELKRAESWARSAQQIQDGLMIDWIQRY